MAVASRVARASRSLLLYRWSPSSCHAIGPPFGINGFLKRQFHMETAMNNYMIRNGITNSFAKLLDKTSEHKLNSSDVGKRFFRGGRGGSTFQDIEQEQKDQEGNNQGGKGGGFRMGNRNESGGGGRGGRGARAGTFTRFDVDDDDEATPKTPEERKEYMKIRERAIMLSKFQSIVIDVNRTFKKTKSGGDVGYTALVVCGNGDGVVGWAKGKAPKANRAIKEASTKAFNNLYYFERFKGVSIYHYIEAKYEKTKVRLWPEWTLGMFRAAGIVRSILKLAGITSVKSKLIGSANPVNTVRATFLALSKIKTPKEYEEKYWRAVVEKHLILDQNGKPIPENRKFNSWVL